MRQRIDCTRRWRCWSFFCPADRKLFEATQLRLPGVLPGGQNPYTRGRHGPSHCRMSGMLEVKNLSVGYRGSSVLEDISFHVRPATVACLLGPSGCGKTTLLRTVAGFEPALAGEVRVDGQCISSVDVTLAPERRGIGMVFQENALFPHLSVEGNVAFGLRDKTSSERRALVAELLDVVGLGGEGARFVHELSGGKLVDETRASFPAVSSNAWHSRERWRRVPKSCCSTSLSPVSMRVCASVLVRRCAEYSLSAR